MRRSILFLALLAACTSTPRAAPEQARAGAAPQGRIQIAAARKLPVGSRVTVEGHVSVPTGGYDAGFAIQDSTGGIYIAADTVPRFPGDTGIRARQRQRVRVTGTLVDNHGFLTVKPDTAVASYGFVPEMRNVRTGEVGEATESLWVMFDGRITAPVVDDRPYGWKIMIDDGSGPVQIFVPAHRRFDPAAIRVGERLGGTGLGAQYDSTYEIISYPMFSPRF
ncbi:MAG TPA: hypothetical protein VFS20_13890 [Longimicrobium sp.]|nr:hypothetical protein [Longimicrobium sp.]